MKVEVKCYLRKEKFQFYVIFVRKNVMDFLVSDKNKVFQAPRKKGMELNKYLTDKIFQKS